MTSLESEKDAATNFALNKLEVNLCSSTVNAVSVKSHVNFSVAQSVYNTDLLVKVPRILV